MKSNTDLNKKLQKQRLWFSVTIGVTVIIISFFYGLGVGFSRKTGNAFASSYMDRFVGYHLDDTTSLLPESFGLPSSVHIVPVGKNVLINGKPVDVVMFNTDESVDGLLANQVKRWEDAGYFAVGATTASNGIAYAIDYNSGRRFSMAAWRVASQARSFISDGYPVQGTFSISDLMEDGGIDSLERTGEIPGVPLMPNGRAGALMSTDEGRGRSYTGVYTVYVPLVSAIQYYRRELVASGWNYVTRGNMETHEDLMVNHLVFRKGSHEVTLLFMNIQASLDTGSQERTLISISLSPFWMSSL
jgi:hypothetical protein